MPISLSPGDSHTMTYRVPATKTVPHLYPESDLFQTMPEVFATGWTVGLLEWCAVELLHPGLDDDEVSLGTKVDITHTAPTPPGVELTVTATCTSVDRGYVQFEVRATDGDGDVVAAGTHGRTVVRRERFASIVDGKAERLAHGTD